MFGQKNNDDQQDELSAMDQAAQRLVAESSSDTAPEVPGDNELASAADETVSIPPVPDSVTSDPTMPEGGTADASQDWQHPGAPLDDSQASDTASAAPAITDVISPYSTNAPAAPAQPQPASPLPPISIPSLPASDNNVSDSPTAPAVSTSSAATPADDTADSDLTDIKQRALTELSPLIDELDQAPEDKFRTIMMMIQASDDQNLVSKAYEAAHAIEDEKARAQALLDVVNEINYFTQPHQD